MSLVDFIDQIREDDIQDGVWVLGGEYRPTGVPPLVISLARFQSYRGRTQAALIQELEDYAEEAGITQFNWHVNQDDNVILW